MLLEKQAFEDGESTFKPGDLVPADPPYNMGAINPTEYNSLPFLQR